MNIKPRVFLVDDQTDILKALSRLLCSAGFEVTTFESAQDFLDSGNADALGCLVLDLSMPGMTGLALQQCLTLRASVLPIVFLSAHGDIDVGVRAMKLGAADFLTKPVDGDKLIAAVHTAIEKNRQAKLCRAELDDINQRLVSLTPREREVLALVVDGKLNKQAADALGTVEKTIKVHRARVMKKMKVKSLAELVRLADRAGVRRSDLDR
ncbi:MAG: DNA-binding response regulator [Herbaspirillum sp.]|jgi:FixJ family two-component response regulator|nr:DNA-binding response regulator [Herbaspirillum sp.]